MRDIYYIPEIIILMIQCVMLIALSSCSKESRPLKPEIFEANNISTELVEYSPSLSSSGSEIYFARSLDKWGSSAMKSSIYYSTRMNNKWSPPKLASFSGLYNDSSPHLSNGGKTMYFVSKRPSNAKQVSADIWKVEKNNKGNWGPPSRLNKSINSQASEYSPRTDKSGNLYFASNRPGGYGQGDLYMAENENGEFNQAVNLGSSINSDKGEWNLELSEDGETIIFEASEREENFSSYGDLYISFKQDNRWTIPQNILELNTTGSDLYPHLANHDKTLYYTSSDSLKSTNTDIYYVEFESIYDKYKRSSTLLEK